MFVVFFFFLPLIEAINVHCLLNAKILSCRCTITKYAYIPPPARYFKCVPACGDHVNEGGMEVKCSSKCTAVITLTIHSAVLLIKLTILPPFVFVFLHSRCSSQTRWKIQTAPFMSSLLLARRTPPRDKCECHILKTYYFYWG